MGGWDALDAGAGRAFPITEGMDEAVEAVLVESEGAEGGADGITGVAEGVLKRVDDLTAPPVVDGGGGLAGAPVAALGGIGPLALDAGPVAVLDGAKEGAAAERAEEAVEMEEEVEKDDGAVDMLTLRLMLTPAMPDGVLVREDGAEPAGVARVGWAEGARLGEGAEVVGGE